jgi:hypothetical protein
MSESPETGPPLATSRFLAFFDECGDHSLVKIDPDFPLFVLALVVVERTLYLEAVLPEVNKLKLRYWNHEGVNLHSRDIRVAAGPFNILLNSSVRLRFMEDLSQTMARIPFTLFLVAIHKQRHLARFLSASEDPYELALKITMDRLVHFLDWKGELDLPIVAEARGKAEDNSLFTAFGRIFATGAVSHSAEKLQKLRCPIVFQPKLKNIVGTQIADLCAYPCARHILNPERSNRAFAIVQKKVYQNGGVTGWEVTP